MTKEQTHNPHYRLRNWGTNSLSNLDLVQIITGKADLTALEAKVTELGAWHMLKHLSVTQLQSIFDSSTPASRLACAIELGQRLYIPPVRATVRHIQQARLRLNTLALEDQEELWVLSINVRNELVNTTRVYRGSTNTMAVRVKDVLRPVLLSNAPAFLVAHNHPSGDPNPSGEDTQTASAIKAGADLLGLKFLDMLIVAPNDKYFAYSEHGLVITD